MDILQATLAVVFWRESKQLTEAIIPCRGHIIHVQAAIEHAALDVEAQENVQVVGCLIGLDADRRECGAADEPKKIIERKSIQLRENFLRDRIPLLPKFARASDMIFP